MLSEQPRSDPLFIWRVFLVALGLRLGFVLLYPQVPIGRELPSGSEILVYGDDRMYDQVGWNLATGKGFTGGFAGQTPRAGRPAPLPGDPEVGIGPIYPAFLGLIYLTFGHHLTVVRIAQAFLSAAVILLLYPRVQAAFGTKIAKLSGWLIAVYPPFIIYSGVLLTETLFLFFLALLIWALICALQFSSAWRWLVAGSVMGITILLRQEALVMVPVFVGLLLWQFPLRGLIRSLPIFLLLTVLCVGVWTVRNYLVSDKLILVSAHGGDTLWISTKGWAEWRYDDPELRSLVHGLNYIEQNEVLHREGMRNILNNPLHYLILCIKRLRYFWISSHTTYLVGFTDTYRQYYLQGAFGKLLVKIVLLGVNLSLSFLGAWGMFITFRVPREMAQVKLFFLIPILVVAIIHFFLYAAPRYQVPIMPFVLVFAAVGCRERFGAPLLCCAKASD